MNKNLKVLLPVLGVLIVILVVSYLPGKDNSSDSADNDSTEVVSTGSSHSSFVPDETPVVTEPIESVPAVPSTPPVLQEQNVNEQPTNDLGSNYQQEETEGTQGPLGNKMELQYIIDQEKAKQNKQSYEEDLVKSVVTVTSTSAPTEDETSSTQEEKELSEGDRVAVPRK